LSTSRADIRIDLGALLPAQPTIDVAEAIQIGQLQNVTYDTAANDLTNKAGQALSAGGVNYTVVTTIYANDLATDMNPSRGDDEVSIGLICQVAKTGDVVITIRGTEGTLEWVHDAEFLQVPCPFLVGAGHTEDGFTAMYKSLRTGAAANSPTVVSALAKLPYPHPVTSVTICGHSLGGALATLLALDVAANTTFKDPAVYTFGSPRTGDALFANTFDQVVKNSYRVANRLDIVPTLPPPVDYQHVLNLVELNPIRFLPLPPKILVKSDPGCEHSLQTYLYLLSLQTSGPVFPLESTCQP
jgi:predicted lipase